ncbi:MAG TPA: CvpA family protein [Thermomicrobiaceae bacterium]|nr:CvpA family protein [Thermomicrobiaceae bacterium]
MNWVDVLIVVVVLLGALAGLRRGFLRGALDLVLVAIGLLAGAVAYRPAAALITHFVHRSGVAINVLGFAAVALIVQGILSLVAAVVLGPPVSLVRAFRPFRVLDDVAGIVPGAVKGAVLATLLVLAGSLITLGAGPDAALQQSQLAHDLLTQSARATTWTQGRTGLNLADFTIITEPSSEAGIQLPFRFTNGLTVDQADEQRMLQMLNQARTSHGLKPLTMDPKLQATARAHSREMFELGYFSHTSPVSGTVLDRFKAAGITYTAAGENLAYAPDVTIAERSLMQSPGHRANILSPDFTRVGIGIIVAPTGGKMFTQDFSG